MQVDLSKFNSAANMNELIVAVRDSKWDFIGKGMTSICFGRKGYPYVIKICLGDLGQYSAIKMFREHQNIKAFPKIYGYADVHNSPSSNTCIVAMEKLLPQRICGSKTAYNYHSMAKLFGEEAARVVTDTNEYIGSVMDLHEENIMRRGWGELVVMDPFYCGNPDYNGFHKLAYLAEHGCERPF